MIFIIDDDRMVAECVAKACGEKKTRIFGDALAAMAALADGLPELILMDVMLTGPDGFTFLNEMISYTDTSRVPVVLITTVDLAGLDLSVYGVVGVLNKDTMRPEEIRGYVEKYC